jgi:hypothetical protein
VRILPLPVLTSSRTFAIAITFVPPSPRRRDQRHIVRITPKDVPREPLLKPLIGRCATARGWPPRPVWMMRRDDELFAVVPSHLVATISGCDESCRTGRQFSRSRSTARLMAA